jgi:enoyl-CoA hydratase
VKTNYQTLKVEIIEQILHLTINRPDKLNALSEEVLHELKTLFTEIKEQNTDYKMRGILFTGAGDKAFIAGADIKGMSTMSVNEALEFAKLGQEVTLLIERCPIPVIACVDGFALGGGCEMAMSADLIYATEKSVFGQPEINLALIPGFGGTQRLGRYIGQQKAKEFIYTGRNFKAPEAFELGLVAQLFENREEMIAQALKFFETVKQKSPLILSYCKQTILDGDAMPIEKGLEIEQKAFGQLFSTEDKTEGLQAFLEKRPAVFRGK